MIVVRWLNAALTAAFDLLFAALGWLGPLGALVVFSLIAGVVLVWIFGKISNQDRIRTVRDRMRGNLMAIRLFGDDLGLLFRLQGRILGHTANYLRLAFLPLLVLLVPVLVVLVQLDLRLGARPLVPGERVLVKVKLRDPALARGEAVTLAVPQGVTLETPPVRAPSEAEVAWRVRGDAPGRHRLTVAASGESADKELRIGGGLGATSARRTGAGIADAVLHPGEPPLPASHPIESIDVTYPPLELRAFGFGVDWLLAFLVLSLVSGFALRGWLGVEI